MLGDTETFTVEYSSELVDATVVTNEENKIQNYFPHITWLVMTGWDRGIVEYDTDNFSATTNMDN